jgi:hypothetical protein
MDLLKRESKIEVENTIEGNQFAKAIEPKKRKPRTKVKKAEEPTKEGQLSLSKLNNELFAVIASLSNNIYDINVSLSKLTATDYKETDAEGIAMDETKPGLSNLEFLLLELKEKNLLLAKINETLKSIV